MIWIVVIGLRVSADEVVQVLDRQDLVLRDLEVPKLFRLDDLLPPGDQIFQEVDRDRVCEKVILEAEVNSTYRNWADRPRSR